MPIAAPPPSLPAAIVERHRFAAPEARQGAVADRRFVYAIGNSEIALYDKASGRRVRHWQGDPARFPHLNSCIVRRRLVCAGSNYPAVPMRSMVVWFDRRTLQPVRVREATTGRHVHLVLENEKNEGGRLAPGPQAARYDAQWNDEFHHVLHVSLTGERQGYYADYAHAPFDGLAHSLAGGYVFAHSERDDDGHRIERTPAAAQPLATMVNFFGNHDQVGNRAFGERLGHLVPSPAAELAMLATLLTPAIPLVFMGDEFGAETPFLYFADWTGELREAVRAGRQREFRLEAGSGRELPDPCDAATFERSRLDWAQAESPAGRERLALLRAALAARAAWITPRLERLRTGGHTARRVGATGLQAEWAYDDGARLVMQMNLGGEAVTAPDADASGTDPQGPTLFEHRWQDGAAWAPWSARWTLHGATA